MIRVKIIEGHHAPYLYRKVQVSEDMVAFHVIGRDEHGFVGPFRYEDRGEAIRAVVRRAVQATFLGYEGSALCYEITLDKSYVLADQYGALCMLALNPSLCDGKVFELVEENPDITLTGCRGHLEITRH